MFVTMPHFEQWMPKKFVPEGHQYWQAVTLTSSASWYMVVYEAECDGEKMLQTTLVAWEKTLCQMLEVLPANAARSVSLYVSASDTGAWTQRPIQALWSAAPPEVERTGQLLIRFMDDDRLFDANFSPVPACEGRTLLYQATN